MEQTNEDSRIQSQLDVVNRNKAAYEVVMHDEGVSPLYVIQCFQDWFSSAVRLFYNVLGEDDPIFLSFKSADVTGNRYVLAHVYQSLQADYTILLEKVQNVINQWHHDKNPNNKVNVDKIKLLQDLLSEVSALAYEENFDDDYIRKKTNLYIKKCFGNSSNYIEELHKIRFVPTVYYIGISKTEYYESFKTGQHRLINLITTMIEDLRLPADQLEVGVIEDATDAKNNKKSKNIFIVHGHNETIRIAVEAYVRSIGYEPIVLFKEPNKGQTIIEKIESNAKDVCFAIVLYTACDEGKAKEEKELKHRARQNVVFEHGYMCSKLGRDHVVALVERGVEQPGDLSGIVYIGFDGEGAWQVKIAKEMQAVGLEVELGKIKL